MSTPLKRNTDLCEASQFLAGRLLPLPDKPWQPRVPQNWSEEVWASVREQRMRPRRQRVYNDLGIAM